MGADQKPAPSERQFVPTILTGVDGELPAFVSVAVAATSEIALDFAGSEQGGWVLGEGEEYEVTRVLMRELDPIACKVRGYDEGWWVECTARSKKARPFWKIDA